MIAINPNHRLRTELAAVEPPLWAGLCASYHDAKILDAEAEDLTLEETETAIRLSGEKDVLIVVMGNNPSVSSTPKMPVAEALADRIKDLKVSFTGIHPIAVGYQKYPVLNRPFEGFPSIPFDRLPIEKYRAHNWHCLDGSPRSPYASVYTSLGCPYNCWFCNIHTLYGDRQVRFRPVEDVLKEIELLVTRYKVRNIKIWDELFALKEDRVISICEGLKDYDLNIWAYARVDTVTQNMLRAMKAGHITWLAYGFESQDAWVRNEIMYKGTTQEATDRAIRMTKEAGINIIANFMLGLPNISAEEDWKTLAWAKMQLFEFINVYHALPYPGSPWYDTLRATGESERLGREWEEYNQYKGFGFRNQYYEKTPLYREQFFNEYFSNPAYLEMIRNRFGTQGEKQIKDMLEMGAVR